ESSTQKFDADQNSDTWAATAPSMAAAAFSVAARTVSTRHGFAFCASMASSGVRIAATAGASMRLLASAPAARLDLRDLAIWCPTSRRILSARRDFSLPDRAGKGPRHPAQRG